MCVKLDNIGRKISSYLIELVEDKSMNRMQLMTVHVLLAAFILPIAAMFAITGSFYTWGIKGGYIYDVYEITLDKSLTVDNLALKKLAESELKTLDISPPEGNPKIKKIGNNYLLEWTGSSKDLILEPTDNDLIAKLTIKNTSWYRHLVQLHKAKGGTAFKIYAVVFAVALGLLLITGIIMALQTPKLKFATLVSALIGFISFIAFTLLS